MTARIGSLFSGYGGLDLGVSEVLDAETVWFCEIESAPSKILAHHWPDVPNHGDITLIDWSTVEPVDILTGGFPCQDVSLAGARAGLKEGTRSGLWAEFARAIDVLKPGLVVIENVRGLLSAEASGPVESDPWGLGNGADGFSLRALGAVLGDLADLGYDAEWCGVRASDAGAPHGRFRIFILAHPAGGRRDGWARVEVGGAIGRTDASGIGEDTVADPGGEARKVGGRHEQGGQAELWRGRPDDGGRTLPVADTVGGESERCGIPGDVGSTPGTGESAGDQRERLRDTVGDSGSAVAWGQYRPAIERWERIIGRLAPAPTVPDGRDGAHRLSPIFEEWMMGLAVGHVTDPAIGLTRNEQVKVIGNGVVPQQVALALTYLLSLGRVAA